MLLIYINNDINRDRDACFQNKHNKGKKINYQEPRERSCSTGLQVYKEEIEFGIEKVRGHKFNLYSLLQMFLFA